MNFRAALEFFSDNTLEEDLSTFGVESSGHLDEVAIITPQHGPAGGIVRDFPAPTLTPT